MAGDAANLVSSDHFSWDTAVFESTADFRAQGDTVLLEFAGDTKTLRVSRSLMAHWSPVFRDIFTSATGESVILHNDYDEFRSFLWFIHVDPISFADYTTNCPVEERFRRALGIATVASFYDSSDITKWAVAQLVSDLSTCTTAELLPRLHRLANSCRDLSPEFHDGVREQWRAFIKSTVDPVATLSAAKEINDSYLQAYAYFHILQKTNGEISQDARLSSLDRMRLLVGAVNLRRYEEMNCTCTDRGNYHHNRYNGWSIRIPTHKLPRPQGAGDVDLWSPITSAPLQDSYDKHSLWDMFTVSPLGLVLHDGVELSQPSAPPTSST